MIPVKTPAICGLLVSVCNTSEVVKKMTVLGTVMRMLVVISHASGALAQFCGMSQIPLRIKVTKLPDKEAMREEASMDQLGDYFSSMGCRVYSYISPNNKYSILRPISLF